MELLIVQIQATNASSFQFHAHWPLGIVEGEADDLISALLEFQSKVDADSFRAAELIGKEAHCNYWHFRHMSIRYQPSGGATCHTTLAGLPDTTASSGTLIFTTDPIATTAPRPMVTPFIIVEPLAIHA